MARQRRLVGRDDMRACGKCSRHDFSGGVSAAEKFHNQIRLVGERVLQLGW